MEHRRKDARRGALLTRRGRYGGRCRGPRWLRLRGPWRRCCSVVVRRRGRCAARRCLLRSWCSGPLPARGGRGVLRRVALACIGLRVSPPGWRPRSSSRGLVLPPAALGLRRRHRGLRGTHGRGRLLLAVLRLRRRRRGMFGNDGRPARKRRARLGMGTPTLGCLLAVHRCGAQLGRRRRVHRTRVAVGLDSRRRGWTRVPAVGAHRQGTEKPWQSSQHEGKDDEPAMHDHSPSPGAHPLGCARTFPSVGFREDGYEERHAGRTPAVPVSYLYPHIA